MSFFLQDVNQTPNRCLNHSFLQDVSQTPNRCLNRSFLLLVDTTSIAPCLFLVYTPYKAYLNTCNTSGDIIIPKDLTHEKRHDIQPLDKISALLCVFLYLLPRAIKRPITKRRIAYHNTSLMSSIYFSLLSFVFSSLNHL